MTTWTNTTKSSTTFSNGSKSSTTFSNGTKTLAYSNLLMESGSALLLEAGDNLLLELAGVGIIWANTAKT